MKLAEQINSIGGWRKKTIIYDVFHCLKLIPLDNLLSNKQMRNYQNLEAWQSAMQLIKEVYLISKTFPKEEIYALTSQAKRAAVSIAANIAEGMGRQSKKDTIHFLHISRGSIYELETLLKIAVLTDIMKEEKFKELIPLFDSTVKLLSGLINYNKKAMLK